MIKLILVFLVIYISFMAVAISYAKAFRVKNQVINIVEQYQYSGRDDQRTIGIIDDYLKNVPYNYGTNDSVRDHCSKQSNSYFTQYGACIIDKSSVGDTRKYYKVITYIAISFPFFNIHMVVPISGETKVIHIN